MLNLQLWRKTVSLRNMHTCCLNISSQAVRSAGNQVAKKGLSSSGFEGWFAAAGYASAKLRANLVALVALWSDEGRVPEL